MLSWFSLKTYSTNLIDNCDSQQSHSSLNTFTVIFRAGKHHILCKKEIIENILPLVFYGLILVGSIQFDDSSLKMSCHGFRMKERQEYHDKYIPT